MKVFNIIIILSFCIIIIIIIMSCTGNKDEKKYRQLRKDVISHYKTENNSLKEKAAKFLLDNLKDRYTIEGKRYQAYSDTIKKYCPNGEVMQKSLFPLKNEFFDDSLVRD